jgi:hypothetical protein
MAVGEFFYEKLFIKFDFKAIFSKFKIIITMLLLI